jgi:hypothetical protein
MNIREIIDELELSLWMARDKREQLESVEWDELTLARIGVVMRRVERSPAALLPVTGAMLCVIPDGNEIPKTPMGWASDG